MPIYEYRCTACRKKVTVLTLRASEVVEPVCEHCGSRALTRLMSRFALVRSEESRLDGQGRRSEPRCGATPRRVEPAGDRDGGRPARREPPERLARRARAGHAA